jgi:ClpP class serine protease
MKTGILQIDPRAFAKTFSVKKMAERYKNLSRNDMKQISDAVSIRRSENQTFYKIVGNTAVIPVVGMLVPKWDWMLSWYDVDQTSYDDIITAIAELEQNYAVQSIEFYFNSPGGYVDGSDETCEAIFASKKPTIARVGSMACSAAYKLASCCGTIIASTKGSLIGSIGTVIETTDWSTWEDTVGIKTVTLTNRTSEEKRPNISEESGKNVIRDELDDIQSVFEDYIILGRSANNVFSIENARSLKGRTVTARKALELGLIDSIGSGTTVTGTENNSVTIENSSKGSYRMENLEKLCSENPELQKQLDAKLAEVQKSDSGAVALATDKAVSAERERMMSVITKSGVQMSETLKDALSTGKTLGDYAIAMLDVHGKQANVNGSEIPTISAPNAQADASVATGNEDILNLFKLKATA